VLKPQNYSTTPAIKAWRPPVPEPLPPAPLLGPKELLGLGLLIGGQIWAWLNGRPKRSDFSPEIPDSAPILGTVPPPGNTVPGSLRIVRTAGTYTGRSVNPPFNTFSGPVGAADFVLQDVLSVVGVTKGTRSNGNRYIGLLLIRTGNQEYVDGVLVGSIQELTGYTPGYTLTWNHPTAVPYENPVTEYQLPAGYEAPQIEPAAVPDAPAPLPLPLPGPATVPQVEPEVQPAVAPVAPGTTTIPLPQVVRTTTTVTTQQKLPGAVTTQNGALPAATPSPVPATNPNAIFPIPGGPALPGNGPRADLGEMAKELGRIEQKLELMLNPGPAADGDWTDRIQLLAQLLKSIYDALTDGANAGKYELTGPCDLDANGDRIVYEAEWPEQGTNHQAILSRVDAIAELLQIHKDLKQPNCRGADVPVSGEFVTVNFEQID
jgi:hypothetical protein